MHFLASKVVYLNFIISLVYDDNFFSFLPKTMTILNMHIALKNQCVERFKYKFKFIFINEETNEIEKQRG